MCYRHKGRGKPQQWLGVIVVMATLLFASAIPGHTWGGGRHGGRGHGFHSGHRWGGHGFHGGHGWGRVGVTIGVGPYWGPYWGPYAYPYTYPYQPAASGGCEGIGDASFVIKSEMCKDMLDHDLHAA